MKMEIDEAVAIIREIATGDRESEAIDVIARTIVGLIDATETYRSLYEGAEKRIMRYRDIASRPDIPYNNRADSEPSGGDGDECIE